jgi:chemotaxis protein MotB
MGETMVVDMGARDNAPIIIKRKKVIVGGGHHGGAWKVAYADFVTAMMAFFMLMWLLNATTEQQRKGIADYFSPTIPINRISGGGEGMFGGTNIFTREALVQDGTGGTGPDTPMSSDDAAQAEAAEVAALDHLEEILLGRGGESMLSEQALRHIVTRLTDEGLIIELFDIENAPLFVGDTDEPTQDTREIAGILARVFAMVQNPIAVAGHTASRPVVMLANPVWGLSTSRAEAIRILLEDGGFDPIRIRRITGFADRKPAVELPFSVRNNRIEITLLRKNF